jgi:hypothetical protein
VKAARRTALGALLALAMAPLLAAASPHLFTRRTVPNLCVGP